MMAPVDIPGVRARRFAASGIFRLSVMLSGKQVSGARFGPVTVYESEGSAAVVDDSDECGQPIDCSNHGTPRGCVCACVSGWTHSQDVRARRMPLRWLLGSPGAPNLMHPAALWRWQCCHLF
jgi:hypothetical protein